jgi:glutathione peroxidase
MKKVLMLFILGFMAQVQAASFHDIVEKDINGKELKLSTLKGKVVLIVNIASQCGFTPQLEDLQKLQTQYGDKGFTVLGVPSNEFGGQTPEGDQDMKEFCQKKYNVNFPLLSKGKVNGKERRPLYKFLTDNKKTEGDIGWNFVKFMVDKNGKIIDRWTSTTTPVSESITKALELALK